jgi:hypothetical protein
MLKNFTFLFSKSLCSKTHLLNFLTKRTKFSDAFFRIHEFEEKKFAILCGQFSQEEKTTELKERLKVSLSANTPLNRQDVENAFYISKSSQDLKLALDAFKK